MLPITKAVLKPWSPCSEGYKWFIKKFPQGADYAVVQKALRDDKRFNDARWLTNSVWSNLIFESPANTNDVTADHTAEALEIIEYTTALKADVTSDVSSADENAAHIGSSGYDARIGSSGNDARIGSSGYAALIGSSGYDARIGSSGYAARINAEGEDAVIACAGLQAKAKAAENGVLALAWYDEATKRMRIAVGYVGEDLKANTWYEVQNGKFVEVSA